MKDKKETIRDSYGNQWYIDLVNSKIVNVSGMKTYSIRKREVHGISCNDTHQVGCLTVCVRLSECLCLRVFLCACVCLYVCLSVRVFVCTCVCMNECLRKVYGISEIILAGWVV